MKTIAKPDEFPNDKGGLCNEEGVPADLDFSDVPMDDDFVFEQEEIDSVIEKGKAATSFSPSKVVPPEDLSIGMEVEVNFATEGVPTVKEIQGVTESSIAEEVEVGPPPLPEPPVVKEIDQTKYLSSKLYPVNEVSPGLFTFGDHSSFRQKREEEGGGYACENCEYHCQRRNQIFYHMRRAHTEKSSAENIFGDGSENNTGEVTSESNLTTRYFPLNLNRTVEVSPGKFEYASKYRFEKRGDQYVCETCGEIIPTRNRMMTHLRYRHYCKFYNLLGCEIMGDHEPVLENVFGFLILVAGRYECELCPKSFSQASKLKSHMEYHSESPQHICDECGVACKSSRCLYNHKQRKHAVEDAKYMCDQCGKYFPSKIGLKSHLSWHANSFQCSKCEDKFPDKKSLVVHRNSHRTAPKMQKCVQCHEEFKTELQLAEHVASAHTEDPTNVVMATVESEQGAKPTAAINNDDTIACNKPEDGKGFPCPKCAKVLKFRKYLSDHMKIHEQKKLEFRCKICGKEAMKKSNVRSHIGYVHGRQYLTKNDAFVEDLREQIPRAGPPKTMERSHTYKSSRFKYELEYNEDGTPKGFQCSECKIVLKKQEYLQEHIKFKHRDGKNIKCKMCGKEFRKQYDCRLHMQKIHHVTVKHEGRKLTKKKKSDDEDESNINESSE